MIVYCAGLIIDNVFALPVEPTRVDGQWCPSGFEIKKSKHGSFMRPTNENWKNAFTGEVARA